MLMSMAVAAAVGIVLVAAAALRFRSRPFAIYALVLLTLVALLGLPMSRMIPQGHFAFACLFATSLLYMVGLVWARPRPLVYRFLITWPALVFVGGCILAIPWVVASAVGFGLPWPWLPFAIAALGLVDSVWLRHEEVDLAIDGGSTVDRTRRHPRGSIPEVRPLRIAQITDPHLGPLMSAARLARICQRAVDRNPDLIVLTGDFLTMESQNDPDILTRALAPLAESRGRVFACRGNHDLEAPKTVATACDRLGIPLLIDQEATVDTAVGPVQLIGVDFVYRGRREHLREVCDAYPRRQGHLRLMLLHDPGAFRHLSPGDADLALSGHTHGGQLGLVRLGLPGTIISLFSSVPDHGFFARGESRLYVHRGTCHYGFPVRVGVPPEESTLNVYWKPSRLS
jgi:predicted MPP superfamily phosphohydrolase